MFCEGLTNDAGSQQLSHRARPLHGTRPCCDGEHDHTKLNTWVSLLLGVQISLKVSFAIIAAISEEFHLEMPETSRCRFFASLFPCLSEPTYRVRACDCTESTKLHHAYKTIRKLARSVPSKRVTIDDHRHGVIHGLMKRRIRTHLPKFGIHLLKTQKGYKLKACNPLFLLLNSWGG